MAENRNASAEPNDSCEFSVESRQPARATKSKTIQNRIGLEVAPFPLSIWVASPNRFTDPALSPPFLPRPALLQAVDLPGVPEPLLARARRAAAWLRERAEAGHTVTVVHHIDADGVTSGAIAAQTLERAGIPGRTVAAKSLDAVHVDALQAGSHDALWFCDFGSTAYMHFPDTPRLVCDHHELVRDGTEEDFPHVNPLLDELSGGDISGAGCAFLVAHAMDAANLDLLPIALVGAAADLQDRGRTTSDTSKPPQGPKDEDKSARNSGFAGTNRALVEHGTAHNLLEVETDLGWFGPETRALSKFLGYGSEPRVPIVTGDRRSAEAFLKNLGVPLSDESGERTWSRLSHEERRLIRSAIVENWLDCGASAEDVATLWRPVVRIKGAEPGTPVREIREFGTLLNSTARYGEPEVGLRVAGGDRGDAYQQALSLLTGHRRHLAASVSAFVDAGVREETAIQWAHVQDKVRDTVVGIVCGMALDSLGLRRDMPLLALAFTDDGRTKVSSRAPHEIQGRIDLATAMREGAAAFGGQGGGHKGAAGATIPRESERAFLDLVDGIVAQQLGIQRASVQRTPETTKIDPQPWQSESSRTGQSTLF